MDKISVPVFNHILCLTMKFHFLCDVIRGKVTTSLVPHLKRVTCLTQLPLLLLSDDSVVQRADPRGGKLRPALRSAEPVGGPAVQRVQDSTPH